MTDFRFSIVEHRIIDGDTIECVFDLGFNIFCEKDVRLINIDTPEIRTKDLNHKKAGIYAKQFVSDWMNEDGKKIFISKIWNPVGKYGERVIGDILNSKTNATICLDLISSGLAKTAIDGIIEKWTEKEINNILDNYNN